VVTAVGHETDVPLVDHAADRRASTPTDAAKLITPDVGEEQQRIGVLRDRAMRCIKNHVETEQQRLDALRSRPAVADPGALLSAWSSSIDATRERARRATLGCVAEARTDIARLAARVTALSPQATLERGYAVLQGEDGHAVRDPAEVQVNDKLTARVAAGRIPLRVAS
jgi:exodeoxyribonuclease VII large subunit